MTRPALDVAAVGGATRARFGGAGTPAPATRGALLLALRIAVVVALASTTLGACSCDTFRFYQVTRSIQEECDIRPNGEFCDEPEGFSPPVDEVWTVERVGDEIRVYVDEEVWVADPRDPAQDANFITAEKLEIAAREPGPCVTTTTRNFAILADNSALTGTIDERSRIEGPDDCGETPTGLRTSSRLDGVIDGAP